MTDTIPIKVQADAERIVPKIVTKVGVSKTSSTYIVSLMFNMPNEETHLVQRIAVSRQLIVDLLEEMNKL